MSHGTVPRLHAHLAGAPAPVPARAAGTIGDGAGPSTSTAHTAGHAEPLRVKVPGAGSGGTWSNSDPPLPHARCLILPPFKWCTQEAFEWEVHLIVAAEDKVPLTDALDAQCCSSSGWMYSARSQPNGLVSV